MSGSIIRDGFELPYIIEGTGLPLLIIGDTPYYQRVFSQRLRMNFQMIFAMHKGFIKPVDKADRANHSAYELQALVEDIEALRQQLGINKFFVLGHSGNAYIALEYAKKFPQHTYGVVMIGIAPDLSNQSKEYGRKNWEAIADNKRKEALAQSLAKTTDSMLENLEPTDYFIADYVRKTPFIWYDYHFDPLPFFEESYFNMDMISYVWGEIFSKIDITEKVIPPKNNRTQK